MDKLNPGKNFASDNTWNTLNDKVNLKFQDEDSSESLFVKKFIKPGQGKDCLEIGSFPGNRLPTIGSLGYTLHGIDISPRNEVELPKKLQEHGFRVGKFVTADIFKHNPSEKYDLVCSFGFIEHFENFREVISLHTKFVKEGGELLITAPNFRGFVQYAVHYLLDRSNMSIHNIKSMNPDIWAEVLEKEGFEIVFKGYFGGLYFWLGNKGRNWFEKKLIYLVHGISSRLNKMIKKDSGLYSYNCGIVARKKSMTTATTN